MIELAEPEQLSLIGLAGRAGAGKTTCAEHLSDRYDFLHLSFADPIKDMLGALLEHLDVDYDVLHSPRLKEAPLKLGALGHYPSLTPRRLMQSLGSEWGRRLVHPDLWVRVLEWRCGLHEGGVPAHTRIVISDVRFPNEAGWLRARGGRLVHVLRAQEPAAPPGHASEFGLRLRDGDFTVSNVGPDPRHMLRELDLVCETLGLTGDREPLPAERSA